MKTPAFDEFAMRMKSQWDAEQRAWDRYEAAVSRMCSRLLSAKSGTAMAPPGSLCKVDERLRPCP